MTPSSNETLERIARRIPIPEPAYERMLSRRDRKRRNQRITAGVVGIAVFVAAVWIVTSVGSLDRSETPAVPGPAETGPACSATFWPITCPPGIGPTVTGPAVPPETEGVGFIGLPPEGAAPSAPERGELVLEFHGGTPYTNMWMYADGRLIWRQFPTNVPYGANGYWGTGLLERRLTPEGLDLVLSEVISTGLFDKNLDLAIEGLTPADSGPQAIKCGFGPGIEVRNRDRLVRLTWLRGCGEPELQLATPEQVDAVLRLVGRLADPASWLPEHAWEDIEIRAYVPSRYAICANRVDLPEGAVWPKTSEIVDLLPGPVKALIYADERAIAVRGPLGGPNDDDVCYEVTTDEARAIVRALDDAGLESELRMSLTYVFDTPGLRWVDGLAFLTILPHGEMG
jgi:hypothetical protein